MGVGRRASTKAVLDAAKARSGHCPMIIPGPCGTRSGIRLDAFKDSGNAVGYRVATWLISESWPAENPL